MRLRRIKWKGHHRDSYNARKEMWGRYRVKGGLGSHIFWSNVWEINYADRLG